MALAALGAAGLGARAVESRRVSRSRTEAEAAAGVAQRQAAQVVREAIELAEKRADEAVKHQPLVAEIKLLGEQRLESGDLAKRLIEWFKNDSSWQLFRQEFPVNGLSLDGDELAVLWGMKAEEFPSGPLVRQARQTGLSSAIVMGKGWPYTSGAAKLVSTFPRPVVVVMGRAIDNATLRDVTAVTGGAALLSDGKQALSGNGANAEVARLTSVVGQESSPVVRAPKGDWAAMPVPVAPGLWIWAFADTSRYVIASAAWARTATIGVWGAGALMAILALVIGLRRPLPVTGS